MTSLVRFLAIACFCGCGLQAADIAGIWMGQVAGRFGEKQDIAFQFKVNKGSLTGVMFGDEFDLPVEELVVSDDRISFSVTSTNYYDGRKTKLVFSGTVNGREMQLTRDRAGGGSGGNAQNIKQTFTLKRLD